MNKTLTNIELAELLRDVAASYKIKDEKGNKFKIIAYERAADAIEHLSSEAKDLWDESKLSDIPGVGSSLTEHLDELFRTGRSKHFDEVMSELPRAIFVLMKVTGIGPKTAYKLSLEFGLSDKDPIQELLKIAKSGGVAKLEGFGVESQERIIKSLLEYLENKGVPKRHLLVYADSKAQQIIDWMFVKSYVKTAVPLGSLRRRASTVGDIDICVATNEPTKAIGHFVSFPRKTRVLEKGDKTASIMLPGGVQVDILVQDPESYGAALQHFTGSKHHNVALREYALKRGMSLSENGIKENGKLRKFDSETKFYNYIGLDWIPPELREDDGEIRAALDKTLPKLVELKDIKGDFHTHSSFDIETSHDLGQSSMEEMAQVCIDLGYEYLAFSEHNPSKSKHGEKAIIDILKRKREAVDQLNYSFKKRVFKVFNSLEIDIMPDGNLPVPENGLETLDFALISIHSSFDLSKAQMTKRVLKAMSYPKVKIFAHPTARKLSEREGVELDWQLIFEECKKREIWLEINASSDRLDLPDFLVHDAIVAGVSLTIDTDSHHVDTLVTMPNGVSVARRGWAETKNIMNTLPLHLLMKVLH